MSDRYPNIGLMQLKARGLTLQTVASTSLDAQKHIKTNNIWRRETGQVKSRSLVLEQGRRGLAPWDFRLSTKSWAIVTNNSGSWYLYGWDVPALLPDSNMSRGKVLKQLSQCRLEIQLENTYTVGCYRNHMKNWCRAIDSNGDSENFFLESRNVFGLSY